MVAGAVICAFALVPGLPKIPFLVIGGAVLAFGGRALTQGGRRRGRDRAQEAAALAAAPRRRRPRPRDQALDALALDPLELAIGFGLVPLVDARAGGSLLSARRP